MNDFKAALIDLDGFLISSEELFFETNKVYFKQFGLERFTPEMHRNGIGVKAVVEMQKYKDKGFVKTNLSPEEIADGRDKLYWQLAKDKLALTRGALEFLHTVKANFKTALVTSSKREYLDLVFSLFDIAKYFDVIVTGDVVLKGKPEPDPYLVSAEKLNVDPKECVVFEDAPAGVLSGKAAGMFVVAVPNRFVVGDLAFDRADKVFADLIEVEKWLK